MKKLRVFINCTKLRIPPDVSWEMKSDPETGKPLVQYSLDMCKSLGLEPIVISRVNKDDLNEYLDSLRVRYEFSPRNASLTESISGIQRFHDDKNIIIDPTVRFTSEDKLLEIASLIEFTNRTPVGIGKVTDPTNWVVIQNDKISPHPKTDKPMWAVGIIGFKRKPDLVLLAKFGNFKRVEPIKSVNYVILHNMYKVNPDVSK